MFGYTYGYTCKCISTLKKARRRWQGVLYDRVAERKREREREKGVGGGGGMLQKKREGYKETGTLFPATYFSQKRLLKF